MEQRWLLSALVFGGRLRRWILVRKAWAGLQVCKALQADCVAWYLVLLYLTDIAQKPRAQGQLQYILKSKLPGAGVDVTEAEASNCGSCKN